MFANHAPAGGLMRRAESTEARRCLAAAAALFAAIFALRAVEDDPDTVITVLYALPIALVAAELGLAWGLAAAALALALFGVWDLSWSDGSEHLLDYAARGAAYLAVGASTGALADRLRRVSDESERFWVLSGDLLCTAGFDGYFKRLNPAWERTLGWTVAELCARPFVEFVHPDDRERTATEAASLESAGYETLMFENRYRCKDGSYRTILWSARARSQDGLIYATGTDITAGMQAQDELRRSEQFLDSVLENLPHMVFVKDAAQLRFVRFNRAGEELLGISRDELIGKSDHDLFPAEEADAFVAKDREALACPDVVDIPDEPLVTADKGVRTLHTRKIAIRDEAGTPRYLLGISEDITDRQQAERTADAARVDADRANRAKSDFLSRMSHELRTPLNAVIGFGQLLALDDLDEQQSEGVDQILKAGRHLLQLINEVLDISRIESGTMSMSLEPVHLGSVVAEALSLIRPIADDARIRLVCEPSQYAELHVLADQQRLKQVLINLLSNAVKYNRRDGEVVIRWAKLPDERVEVSVADTGRGMSGEQLERLFEPFDRLGAESSGVEGTGLGLSLSKGLTEAMGGRLSAESELGVGSTLRVELDAAPPDGVPQEVAVERAEGAARAGPTIVYIDDNVSNLKLVEQLLDRLPEVRLITAVHGQLGVALVREHQPDLVLLDLHLPDLHGREVLLQLKQDPATAAIPVVVLSADAPPAQLARLRRDGVAGCIPKPVDVRALLAVLRANTDIL